jgi:hypothetical protein
MSLVGSLEDLGLGEILQIVSLSGKSGVLWIRSRQGEGRIVFDRGSIRGAFVEGGPRDLRGMLAATGALPDSEVESFAAEADAEGVALQDVLVARTALDAARLDELRERHVETTVLRMFGWLFGEFSFEIRDEPGDVKGADLLLRAGINAQFLALEGTRLRDENANDADQETDADDEPTFAGEDAANETADVDLDLVPELEITVLEMLDDALPDATLALPIDEPSAAEIVDEDPTLTGEALAAEPEAEVEASAIVDAEPARAIPVAAPPVSATPAAPALTATPAPAFRAVVVIDRDWLVLEWAKQALAPLGLRTHIFPRAELGIERIRQYFARGEMPLVVLSTDTPADPVSGARDWAEIAARLRAQVPGISFVVLAAAGAAVVPANERSIPDAVAARPPKSVIADERAREKRERFSQELRTAVEQAQRRPNGSRLGGAPRENADPMRALREWSARLRESSPPSEVLRLVLEFSGRHFDRSVMFLVRDGEAQAMAQIGLATTGGPDDVGLRSLCVSVEGPEAFRKVIESGAPTRATPTEAADRALVARLGTREPAELYVAPIESGEQVVALLYADNAATGRALGDTSALEVIAHEAGLALDRAVLERALEQAEGERRSGSDAGEAS